MKKRATREATKNSLIDRVVNMLSMRVLIVISVAEGEE